MDARGAGVRGEQAPRQAQHVHGRKALRRQADALARARRHGCQQLLCAPAHGQLSGTGICGVHWLLWAYEGKQRVNARVGMQINRPAHSDKQVISFR